MKEYNAEQEYQIREKRYSMQFEKEKQWYIILSNLRLAAFLGIIFGVVLFYFKYRFPGSVLSISSLLLFIFFIFQHEKVKNRKDQAYSLLKLNQQAIERITGKWVEFRDKGEEYSDQKHPYSDDLDIFGQASVFQWINSTFTYLGRELLKGSLIEPLKDTAKIKERQAAINELADKLDWRQHFLAEGSSIVNGMRNPDSLFEWAENENPLFRYKWVQWGIKLISSVMLCSIFLLFISFRYFLFITGILLFTQLILFAIGYMFYFNGYEATNLYRDTIAAFQKSLTRIEKEKFESKYLSDLKSSLIDSKGNCASKQINELYLIVDMMSFENSPVLHFLLNVILLWDYHCMISLEKWKQKSGHSLREWLTTIGRVEELSSIAAIRYDNPKWCIPQFSSSKYYFSAKEMGHPLLPLNSRVCNDVNINASGNVLLITGSNMSGKSTLLRTAGLNLLLAYIGAPVCANDFKCSIMNIYTSMRVNDDLEKKISSFYAELLRIKAIIEAAGAGNALIFLLDEIFRGTNTKDRHIGARAVLRKLSKMGTIGLVSTHDLELGELESEKDIHVKNYHFIEHYENNQIMFDYKLRPGVSKTTNAVYLMKMVGIDEL